MHQFPVALFAKTLLDWSSGHSRSLEPFDRQTDDVSEFGAPLYDANQNYLSFSLAGSLRCRWRVNYDLLSTFLNRERDTHKIEWVVQGFSELSSHNFLRHSSLSDSFSDISRVNAPPDLHSRRRSRVGSRRQ
jgi:hypothetical protein